MRTKKKKRENITQCVSRGGRTSALRQEERAHKRGRSMCRRFLQVYFSTSNNRVDCLNSKHTTKQYSFHVGIDDAYVVSFLFSLERRNHTLYRYITLH